MSTEKDTPIMSSRAFKTFVFIAAALGVSFYLPGLISSWKEDAQKEALAKPQIRQIQPQQTVVEVYPIVAPVGEWSPEYDVERKHFECRRDKTKSLVIMKNGVAPEIVCVPGTEVMLGDNIKTLRFKSGESTPLKFQMKVWE